MFYTELFTLTIKHQPFLNDWCRQRKPAVTAKMFRQALMLSGFQEVMQAGPTRRAVCLMLPGLYHQQAGMPRNAVSRRL